MPATDEERFMDCDPNDLLAQIGAGNWSAISGRRVDVRPTGITLPCGNGYSVKIDLHPSDTYVVRRVFTRSGREFVHGEQDGVYRDKVGEVAYRAGMFRDPWPGGGIPDPFAEDRPVGRV
jgi:hypothetical protein